MPHHAESRSHPSDRHGAEVAETSRYAVEIIAEDGQKRPTPIDVDGCRSVAPSHVRSLAELSFDPAPAAETRNNLLRPGYRPDVVDGVRTMPRVREGRILHHGRANPDGSVWNGKPTTIRVSG